MLMSIPTIFNVLLDNVGVALHLSTRGGFKVVVSEAFLQSPRDPVVSPSKSSIAKPNAPARLTITTRSQSTSLTSFPTREMSQLVKARQRSGRTVGNAVAWLYPVLMHYYRDKLEPDKPRLPCDLKPGVLNVRRDLSFVFQRFRSLLGKFACLCY